MKPQRFDIGQAVTPNIREDRWFYEGTPSEVKPKFGEIYHVKMYDEYSKGSWYIILSELPNTDAFNEAGFDPVISTNVLEKELNSIEIKV